MFDEFLLSMVAVMIITGVASNWVSFYIKRSPMSLFLALCSSMIGAIVLVFIMINLIRSKLGRE